MLFFAGTSAIAGATAACEKATDSSTFGDPDGALDKGMAGPFYGAPPIDSGASVDARDADADDDASD